jgi:hypothetical protein
MLKWELDNEKNGRGFLEQTKYFNKYLEGRKQKSDDWEKVEDHSV